MALNKLRPIQIEAFLSGKNKGNYRMLLSSLSKREIRPEQCACTTEEYEEYVKRAQEMIKQIKEEK